MTPRELLAALLVTLALVWTANALAQWLAPSLLSLETTTGPQASE